MVGNQEELEVKQPFAARFSFRVTDASRMCYCFNLTSSTNTVDERRHDSYVTIPILKTEVLHIIMNRSRMLAGMEFLFFEIACRRHGAHLPLLGKCVTCLVPSLKLLLREKERERGTVKEVLIRNCKYVYLRCGSSRGIFELASF
jgi:hypothetical protein